MNKKLIFFKKSALIFICTFLFPSISYAEYNWEKIGSNLSGTTYFVDTSSIKQNGKFVRSLRMADYFEPNSYGDLSSQIYEETDCSNLSYRYIKDVYYELSMGNGKVTSVNNEISEWYAVKSNSIGEKISLFVCNY